MRREDIARFRSKVVGGPDCWTWTGSHDQRGYAVFWMEGRQNRAARVALRIDGRPVPDDMFVCHHCDNPGCVRPTHLYVGSHQDNMDDRAARGRTASGDRMPHQRVHGERVHTAKLTEADVLSIRDRYEPGTGGVLMREYGITQATLWSIVNRRSWKHLDCGHVDPVFDCDACQRRVPA